MDAFKASALFDLTECSFSEIFVDTENAWDALPKLEEFLRIQFESGKIKPNYKDSKDVYIGEGTKIQDGAQISGPAIIGKQCIISHAALLRDACLLGDNVRIGHAVEVKHSIFLNNTAAAHLNYVGDSIIGNNVNISGGTILANFRLDKKPVTVKVKEEKITTRLQKLGSIIGDSANVGVNAVLNPGTILGKNCIVYPLVLVTGFHDNDEVIKH